MLAFTLKSKKQNWLLILAGYLFCQYIFISLNFEDIGDSVSDGRQTSIGFNLQLWLILFIGIIAAPFIEEVAFRGIFSKKKWVNILSIICLVVFSYFSLGIFITCIVLPILFFFYRYKSKVSGLYYILVTVMITSSIFSISHFSNFKALFIDQLLFFSYYIAFSFFCCWLVINYSLKASIIFHILLNLFVFTRDLPFKNKELQEKTYDKNVSIKWRERSFFDNEIAKAGKTHNHTFYIENGFPIKVSQGFFSLDSINNHLPVNELAKYDIEITSEKPISDAMYFKIMRDVRILKKKSYQPE